MRLGNAHLKFKEMKKMILTVATVLTVGLVNAQEFQENFLGEDFLQYKGTLLKLKSDEKLYLNNVFYSDLKDCKASFSNNVMYKKPSKIFQTEEDSLRNKVFKVENIIDKNGEVWEGKRKAEFLQEPFFVLRDTLRNKTFYFKYHAFIQSDFPFITSEIKLDETLLSNRVEREIDEFTGEIKINTPNLSSSSSPVKLYKNIDKGVVKYYLRLRSNGNTVNVNQKGVILLFSDGSKWVKDSHIDVEVGRSNYYYSAFISLTPEEVDMFINKEISKFRLYIYDNEINNIEAKKFKTFVKIIKSMK